MRDALMRPPSAVGIGMVWGLLLFTGFMIIPEVIHFCWTLLSKLLGWAGF